MTFCNPADLPGMMAKFTRILGLDLGSKTIGIAISDPFLRVASPITTIQRRKFTKDAEELARIVEERNVGAFLIGLPLNMDGTEGPRCQSTRDFARELILRIDLPVAFFDERMSTMAVERAMIDADMTRKKRAARVDQLAAAYILQAALDTIPD
ncbi:Holliday junction resolvase RuvX [Nisaea sp.]|uniref:Holliday junction resolvase RuvX n=1 Tax=Nisaea sp. TaxID=2024842 RepID=UPI002B26D7E9|nr:Holliday junction resolvase RuvX [Nisaea sp.]